MDFIKAILAGLAIAIGSIIYLSLGAPLGAIFFSVGLYLVLWYKFHLFTGKIGYVTSFRQVPKLLLMLLGNFVGASLMFAFPGGGAVMAAKLALPLWQVGIKAIICGVLIYAAVDQHQAHPFAPLLLVPGFIFAGAEHCIADACFIIAARAFTPAAALFLLIVVIGNALGAIGFHQIKKLIEKNDIILKEKKKGE